MPDDVARSGENVFTSEAFLRAVADGHGRRGGNTPTPSEEYVYKYLCDARIEDSLALPLDQAAALAVDLWCFAFEAGDERKIRIRSGKGGASGSGLDIVETVGHDIAFLVDSAVAACVSEGAEVQAVVHPIVEIGVENRSLMQIPVSPMAQTDRERLLRRLRQTLLDVELANVDFGAMRERMLGASARVRTLTARNGLDAGEITESADFLDWLGRHHFTFLGARDYELPPDVPDGFVPRTRDDAGLGVLRDPERHVLTATDGSPAQLTPRVRAFLDEPRPVIVAKSNVRSRVHRDAYADYVGVKRHDANGRVIGETRFVGLFTSEAYNQDVSRVPLIRRKVERIKTLHNAGGSRHSGRALHNVLETFPRDELFQIGEEDLLRVTRGILHLQQRPRPRLFVRHDRFERYISALMFMPREQYSGRIQKRIHGMLAQAFGGRESAAYPNYSEGHLARVHYIVGLNPDHRRPDEDELEREICRIAESWEESLARAALGAGIELSRRDAGAFGVAYVDKFGAEGAVDDIRAIAGMRAAGDTFLARTYHRAKTEREGDVYCKLYLRGNSLDLSDIVPVLENMGLRVRAESEYRLNFVDAEGAPDPFWLHDIVMALPSGTELPESFAEAFTAVWSGRTENDGFNRLVISLGVGWREAALLRALCRYRQQTGMDSSQAAQIHALTAHDGITRLILRMFAVRFDPDDRRGIEKRSVECAAIATEIERALENVSSLDDDRVLRRLAQLVAATVRTNFYRKTPDGKSPEHIAIKIISRELEALPEPKPHREIFVWSPSVEGVHLRFGPVARGGLRWSDRRDDFRTEILGLVKAQQVKNAVIVPVGSKGGFYPKSLPHEGGREQFLAAGQAAYRTFISALIELTDNIEDGHVKPPARCVVWDSEDPYLVVAADKGTATFSDIANKIAEERGFWLGDAFASGGSAGYDHKKMGITARGAWEAVKRHFREIGKDIQSEPFTVIGVGDMSGDVFGNGMLLSPHTRLLAAFNHLHIFIDPDPDPAASFAERQRLFERGRSNWSDYDQALISKGGGVFERSAKSIRLGERIRKMTGLTEKAVPPDVLIAALLRAEVELLWFGGVGTYVKASHEHNPEVGDKANDTLRADARDIRAKVVGEGANLGVTQAGRIEFASAGGRINSDAIDNSAGVDCSDHEVNIKILLSGAMEAGELRAGGRNKLLARMTDAVAGLVLKNNYDQTGALTRMEAEAPSRIDAHEQIMIRMESAGVLDRDVEGLPSAEALGERRQAGRGLTRPELSVLTAYAKIDLFDELRDGDAPDDPAFRALLASYFPEALAEMEKARDGHRLKREIIATVLANRLVNLSGAVFPYEATGAVGIDAGRLARAMEATRCVLDADTLLARIDGLDNVCPAATQTRIYNDIAAALGRAAVYLCVGPAMPVTALIDRYRSGIARIRENPEVILSRFEADRLERRAAEYAEGGVPDDLARDAAGVDALVVGLEAVDIAAANTWPVDAAARIHASLGQLLGIDQMRSALRELSVPGHWENLALRQIERECPAQLRRLCAATIANAAKLGVVPDKLDEDSALITADAWLNPNQALADTLLAPLNAGGMQAWSLARLALAAGALRDFVRRVGDAKT